MPKLQKSNKIVCFDSGKYIFESQTNLFLTFENIFSIYIPHWKLAKIFYKKTHVQFVSSIQKIRGHEKGNLGIGQEETSNMFSFLS